MRYIKFRIVKSLVIFSRFMITEENNFARTYGSNNIMLLEKIPVKIEMSCTPL